MKHTQDTVVAKHTPGPWHIGINPGPMIYGPKGELVADLSADLLTRDERNANLFLLKSAPELLAALQAMLEADACICENIGLKSDQAMRRIAALDMAGAAVARATNANS